MNDNGSSLTSTSIFCYKTVGFGNGNREYGLSAFSFMATFMLEKIIRLSDYGKLIQEQHHTLR